MNHPLLCWLRHHHVPAAILASIVFATVLRRLGDLISSSGGTDVGPLEIGPLWVAWAASVPLLFVATSETDVDKVAPRSLAGRRAVLVGGCAVVMTALPWLLFEPQSAGMAWRDALTLYALGLLSLLVVPAAAVWVVPTLAMVASSMFAWPWHASVWHGLWGALRAPVALRFMGGAPNLSALVCGVIVVAGLAAYCFDARLRLQRMLTARDRTPSRGTGMVAASLAPVVAVIAAGIMTLTVVNDPPGWVGSPRTLLSVVIPTIRHFWIACAAVIGVVTAQTRWRTGLAVWEDVSPRRPYAKFGRPCLRAVVAAVTPALVVTLAATALCVAAMLNQGIPGSVIVTELAHGFPLTVGVLIVMAIIAAASAMVGVLVRHIWITPVVLVAGFAVSLAMPAPEIGSERIDAQMAADYPKPVCAQRGELEVCTYPVNRAYLAAALNSLDQARSRSSHPEAWPHHVMLTETGTMGASSNPTGEGTPSIPIRYSRSYTPGTTLNPIGLLDSLAYSIYNSCSDANVSDLLTIYNGTEEYADTAPRMDRTLSSLADCLKER